MPEVSITLTGLDAVKHIASKYDWNVYGFDYNYVSLCAYRQHVVNGDIQCDTSEWLTYNCPLSINNEEVPILLEDKDWSSKVWLEHDSWVGEGDVIANLYMKSQKFAKWFDACIVDYVVR